MAARNKSPISPQPSQGTIHTRQHDDLFGSQAEPIIAPARDPGITEDRPTIRDDGQFACAICGAPALLGFGVKLLAGQLGRWACSQHRDEVKNSSPSTNKTT
jgi:hypothetical protein